MSEYDSLIEGYPGLDDPANDPGPLSDEEHQAMEELAVPGTLMVVLEKEEAQAVDLVPDLPMMILDAARAAELRALKPDQRPLIGQHYVIFGGRPMPVKRAIATTEDEFVRDQLDVPESLKDHDGQRQARADRTLRLRYRGYVCGEVSSL